MTGVTNLPLARPADDRPLHMDPAEWRLRIELAACYRIFAYLGWVELICKHINGLESNSHQCRRA